MIKRIFVWTITITIAIAIIITITISITITITINVTIFYELILLGENLIVDHECDDVEEKNEESTHKDLLIAQLAMTYSFTNTTGNHFTLIQIQEEKEESRARHAPHTLLLDCQLDYLIASS